MRHLNQISTHVKKETMMLVAENKGFQIYWDCTNQVYNVFKDGKFLIGNKYRFIDVECYIT